MVAVGLGLVAAPDAIAEPDADCRLTTQIIHAFEDLSLQGGAAAQRAYEILAPHLDTVDTAEAVLDETLELLHLDVGTTLPCEVGRELIDTARSLVWLEPTDGPTVPPSADGAVRYLTSTYGLTTAEATDRLGLQGEIGSLHLLAKAMFPDSYAGTWLDHDRQQFVRVAFVETTPGDQPEHTGTRQAKLAALTAASLFSQPARVAAVPAGRTLAELETKRELLTRSFAVLAEEGVAGFGLDLPTSRIQILTTRPLTQNLRLLLDTTAGDGVWYVTRVPEPVGAAAACDGGEEAEKRRQCGNPLRGGIEAIRNNGGRCTTGFVVFRPQATPGVLTAGHCTPPGQVATYEHFARRIGPVLASIEGSGQPFEAGRVDSLYIQLDNPKNAANPDGWTISRWVFASDDAQAYQIRTRIFQGELVPGTIVCRAGIATNERCGEARGDGGRVLQFDCSAFLPCAYRDQVWAEICARGGDSGGPIYGPWRDGNGELFQAAIGQFHTSLSDANPNDAPCGGLINGIEFMWGGRIRQVEAELGVTVNTQV